MKQLNTGVEPVFSEELVQKDQFPIEGRSITEDEIAQYLVNTPAFFERHAQILSNIQLHSAHGARVLSLHERQAQMLRDKIKLLERRIIEMMHYSNDNLLLQDKLQILALQLLQVKEVEQIPLLLVENIRLAFDVPQVVLKLWGIDEQYSENELIQPFMQGVSRDSQTFAQSLKSPYVGASIDLEVMQWCLSAETLASVALIPLRNLQTERCFGLLLCASPDSQRYRADMGVEFLENLSKQISASLMRLM